MKTKPSGIHLDLERRSVWINGQQIPMSPIQLCYYWFFAERAANGEGFLPMQDGFVPPVFTKEIKRLQRQLFPGRGAESMAGGAEKLGKMTSFRSNVTRANRLIPAEQYRIVTKGGNRQRCYGIDVSRESISLTATQVVPSFQREVRIFGMDATLTDVLHFMKSNEYSQVVVRKGTRLTLVTPEAILAWLQTRLHDRPRSIMLDGVTLAQLPLDGQDQSFLFYKPTRTVADARMEFFQRFNEKRPRLSAIIITDSGTSSGKPVGIITPWDFIDKKHW